MISLSSDPLIRSRRVMPFKPRAVEKQESSRETGEQWRDRRAVEKQESSGETGETGSVRVVYGKVTAAGKLTRSR